LCLQFDKDKTFLQFKSSKQILHSIEGVEIWGGAIRADLKQLKDIENFLICLKNINIYI